MEIEIIMKIGGKALTASLRRFMRSLKGYFIAVGII